VQNAHREIIKLIFVIIIFLMGMIRVVWYMHLRKGITCIWFIR